MWTWVCFVEAAAVDTLRFSVCWMFVFFVFLFVPAQPPQVSWTKSDFISFSIFSDHSRQWRSLQTSPRALMQDVSSLTFVFVLLLLYYFIKNSAEQCEHVSNWWTLPLPVSLVYNHTHTHTSANNKCLFLLFWTLEPVCLSGSAAAEKTFVIRLHVFVVVVVVEVQNNGRQSGASSHHPLLLENGKQKHWNVKAFFK